MEVEHTHTALFGQVQQRITADDQVLQSLESCHANSAGFDLTLNCTFYLVQALFDLGPHALLLRQFLQSVVINLESEERRVHWEQGHEQLRGQVVHTTRTYRLVRCVILGVLVATELWDQRGDGVLGTLNRPYQEDVTVANELLVQGSG